MIELSAEQQNIHDVVIDWYKSNSGKYISVGGYAGTGKTTLIGFITETLKNEIDDFPIAYVTYTGKASTVIGKKLKNLKWNDFVGTIHSLIYIPQVNGNGEVVGWTLKEHIPFSLIVLDEASMVGRDIWKDLLSYGVPILVVGDHGQLPPIGENNFSPMKKPDYRLNEIHRQALENPIIKLSMFVREHGYIPTKVFGKSAAKFEYSNPIARKVLDTYDYKTDTQILCGMNKTRVKLNDHVRNLNSFVRTDPYPNEKLICLKNNKNENVMNGQMGFLTSATIETDFLLTIRILMDGAKSNNFLLTHKKAFGKVKYDVVMKETYNKKIYKDSNYDKQTAVNLFDFGYCISVHKSQGSEFKRVVLIDERNYYQSDDDYARWLYTAVTRASEKLIIIDNYY